MASRRLYGFWDALPEGLRTGEPQNEAKVGEDFFATLYADPDRLRGFVKGMTAVSTGVGRALCSASRGTATRR